MNASELSTAEISGKIRKKEISAVECAKAFLDKANKLNPKFQAFLKIHGEDFLKSAEAVDVKVKQGTALGRLAGIPIAIKDNMNVEGWETTCASKILAGYTS